MLHFWSFLANLIILHDFLDAQATAHDDYTARRLTHKNKTPQILRVAEKHGAPQVKNYKKAQLQIHGN
jgi:hypothetical protein